MFEISHILTPVDHSEGGRCAVTAAEFVAKGYQARVIWTHVVPRLTHLMETVLFPYAAMGEDLPEFEAELVQTAKLEIESLIDLELPGRVTCEEPVQGILDEIHRVGPELVVMGVAGESNFGGNQLGSTASRVANRWDGPILLTRRYTGQVPFKRVLVVSDLAPGSEAVVEAGIGLALRTRSTLDVLTVVPDPRSNPTSKLLAGAMKVYGDQVQHKGRRNAKKQFDQTLGRVDVPFPDRESFGSLKTEYTVRFGGLIKEIQEFIAKDEGICLVLGRSNIRDDGQIGLGRSAEKIAAEVPAHVLFVPLAM